MNLPGLSSLDAGFSNFESVAGQVINAAAQIPYTEGQVAQAAFSSIPNNPFFRIVAPARDELDSLLHSVTSSDDSTPTATPSTPAAATTASGPPGSRHVYVLFSGLDNQGSNNVGPSEAQQLEANGVSPNDIILQPCPFPDIHSLADLATNIGDYQQAADPDSQISQSQEAKLEAALQAHGVQPGDQLTFIGHSAGGQEAVTQAALIDRDTSLHVNTVMTMGTPFSTNYAPPDTRLVDVESQGDEILDATDQIPGLSRQAPGFNSYSNRLHIELPATNASGTRNDHNSYVQPGTFWNLVSQANNPQDIEQAPWVDPNQPWQPGEASALLQHLQYM